MAMGALESMDTSNTQDDNSMDEDDLISPEWGFNVFLDQIGQEISDEEITRMKSFCTAGAIGRSPLSKAKTAVSFFQLLRDMDFLNVNNLLHLQAMLWHIDRKDLHQKMVVFAQECRKEPLHFFAPKEKPANGFRHVKFHVGGSKVNRQAMENLRGYVASLMCVKHADVFLVGHSPSNSSVLIFMVPETAVGVLHTLTDEDKDIFTSMKVDCIFIDDDNIPIVGGQVQKSTAISEKVDEFNNISRERDRIRSHLYKVQSCLVDRTEELRQAKENEKYIRRSKDQAMMACLTLLYNHRPVTRLIDSLVSKSALVYFKHCLQQFQAKFPDEMDTIEILLEAKELVACKTEREIWKQHEKNLNLLIAVRTNELAMQNTAMMANIQGMHHNSRLAFGGAVVQQVTGTIEITGVAPLIGIPLDFQPNIFQHRAVTKAMEQISQRIGTEQRHIILRHFGIGKRKRKRKFLEPTSIFFRKLFQMQPRSETPLEFVLETIRLLSDQNLEAKVLQTIREVQQHVAVVQQGHVRTSQVKFTEGLQKRYLEPHALRRLQHNPDNPEECLSKLQDLADVVGM